MGVRAGDTGGRTPRRDGGDGRPLVGDVVVDLEDVPGERDEAVVVAHPAVPAKEWVAYVDRRTDEEVTVADDNRGYDPEAEVVVVAFRDDLDRAEPDYTGERELSPDREDLRTYAFPPTRLDVVGSVREADEDDLGSDMVDLKERLEESASVDVGERDGEPVLVVEKLGAEHVITPEGEVAEGPLSDRLADVAAEFLGGESA